MNKLDCCAYKIGFLAADNEHYVDALRSTKLPSADLVIREAIQNSLDAASPESGLDFVTVQFQMGTFKGNELQCIFGDDAEDSAFCGEKRFFAIRDTYTCGLNGDYTDSKSNYFKLVHGYNNGKNNNDAGAGGSFGIGKTAFCKLGIGIIIYYSRFKKESGYEERLIVFYAKTDVQSPFKEGLLPENIGWWGRKADSADRPIAPVTDSETIRKILDIFGIQPYQEKHTGTTIIIPCTDEGKFLQSVSNTNSNSPWAEGRFKDSIRLCNYLEMSVLKWYAPRLMFPKPDFSHDAVYPHGKKLLCSLNVDGMEIFVTPENHPVFSKIREMYRIAHDPSVPFDTGKIIESAEDTANGIWKWEVKLSDSREHGIYWNKKSVGTLMIMKCPAGDSFWEELPVSQPNVKTAMIYCRKPGMIVDYDTENAWAKSISKLCRNSDDRFLGFFIVNSENTFTCENSSIKIKEKVEALFRNIEDRDHNEWKPEATPKINQVDLHIAIAGRVIDRIKSLTNQAIPRDTASYKAADAISNFLGQYFSPGKKSSIGNPPAGREHGPGGERRNFKKTKIEFKTPEYFADTVGVTVKVPCRIIVNPEQKKINLKLEVAFDDTSYSQDKWEKIFDSEEFPVRVKTIEGKSVAKLDFEIENNQLNLTLDVDKKMILDDLRLVFSISRHDVSFNITEEILQK